MVEAERFIDIRLRRVGFAVVALVAATALAACDTGDGRQMKEPTFPLPSTTVAAAEAPIETIIPVEPTSPPTDLALVAPWPNGEEIPAVYTCDGDDVSPALHWTVGPPGTVEYAISMVDPSADNYVHWVVTGIDPALTSLEEGTLPPGVVAGQNSKGDEGYLGPCPPDPTPHDYVITIYALNQQLELAGTETPAEMVDLFLATNLTTSTVWGSYTRQA